jgi:hypothetical protein
MRTITARDKQSAGARRIASAQKHVEINETAQLDIAVDLKRLRWSLVRDRGNSVRVEIPQHTAHFGNEHQVACGIVLEIVTYLMEMLSWYEFSEGVE